MNDSWRSPEFLTAVVWFGLAASGIALRVRRLWRLRGIVVTAQEDRDYLESVKRSTYLRLATKGVLLVGSLVALFGWPLAFWVWRAGILVVLVLMIWETVQVDSIRDRLGRQPRERTAA